MKKLLLCAFSAMILTTSAVSIVACDDSKEDLGRWEKMKWETVSGQKVQNGTYQISADGETMTFNCKNYDSPWISDAISGKECYYPNLEIDEYKKIESDWFLATMSGNQLRITFEPNNTGEDRALELCVTGGDIFYTFKFKQKAE